MRTNRATSLNATLYAIYWHEPTASVDKVAAWVNKHFGWLERRTCNTRLQTLRERELTYAEREDGTRAMGMPKWRSYIHRTAPGQAEFKRGRTDLGSDSAYHWLTDAGRAVCQDMEARGVFPPKPRWWFRTP